jgi:hypothetical protein
MLLAAGLLLAAAPAQAMVMEAFGNQAVLSGTVYDGDYFKFLNLLRDHPDIDTVILRDSPGGNAHEGGSIDGVIMQRKLNTAVDGYCLSACAYLLLSGVERRFLEGSDEGRSFVGFHGTYTGTVTSLGPIDQASVWENQRWIYAHTDGKADKALVERWTTLRSPNGLIYFYDSARIKTRDRVSIFLCQGNEQRMPIDCERIAGTDGYEQGIFTSKTPLRPNPGAESKAAR